MLSIVACRPITHMLADFDSGKTAVISPDGLSKVVFAKDGTFRVDRKGAEIGVINLFGLSADITIAWSPDSQKFAITFSDGGAEGAFHAHLYQLRVDSVHELSRPVDAAFDDFKSHYYCQARGDNAYAEGWTPDSKMILIITEVCPTGDCGNIEGRMAAYLMNLNGAIARRFGDKQAQVI